MFALKTPLTRAGAGSRTHVLHPNSCMECLSPPCLAHARPRQSLLRMSALCLGPTYSNCFKKRLRPGEHEAQPTGLREGTAGGWSKGRAIAGTSVRWDCIRGLHFNFKNYVFISERRTCAPASTWRPGDSVRKEVFSFLHVSPRLNSGCQTRGPSP